DREIRAELAEPGPPGLTVTGVAGEGSPARCQGGGDYMLAANRAGWRGPVHGVADGGELEDVLRYHSVGSEIDVYTFWLHCTVDHASDVLKNVRQLKLTHDGFADHQYCTLVVVGRSI